METKILTVESRLNSIVKNKIFAWLILGVSATLMFIDNFLKMDKLVGGWHIVLYILLLVPMVYLRWRKELVNPYTKWILPLLGVFIVDMFYYSNELVQYLLPIIFYLLLTILYLTSMQKGHSFYQTLLPRFALGFRFFSYLKEFFTDIFVQNSDRQLYGRIGLALLITLPVLGVFVALLFSADSNFENFLSHLVDFSFSFHPKYIWTVPLSFTLYLLLFIYGVSNSKNRTEIKETKQLDMLIVGIFVGMIVLLFALFIAVQLPFLFGGDYLPKNTNLANFAREGFFQLMMVMGLVMLIFLFIMRRFKGEKLLTFLLSILLIETIVMGLVSLKKMHLYQSIKGATLLRYYVEWFDYFLLVILALGVVFLIKKIKFSKLLDVVAILALLSFTLIVSLNVDAMIAKHNIEKFKDTSEKLDKYALSRLSIDALPVIVANDINMSRNEYNYKDGSYRLVSSNRWALEYQRKECQTFAVYHFGYCSKLKKYGDK